MKILVGVDRLRYGDGISRVAGEIANSLYEKGHDVKIVCSRCDIKADVPVIICKYNKILHQSDILDVLRIIRREKPDIFCSHYYPMDICGAIINSTKTKHIMYSHGISYLSLHLSLPRIIAFIRAHIGEFLGAHFSTKIISVSKFQQTELKKKYKIKANKIEIVHNGINLSKFNPFIQSGEVRLKHDISNNEILLLCVASLRPMKGQEFLIDCIKIVFDYEKNIKLLFVGTAGKANRWYKEALVTKVHNAGLDYRVFFSGFVPEQELPKYYAACDIFVSATKWEGFGLPFAEAMACGKPVIGFDLTGVSELIVDGYNGYKIVYPSVSEMAEKIALLAKDYKMRKEFGQNARKFAEENFNKSRIMELIEKIFYNINNNI